MESPETAKIRKTIEDLAAVVCTLPVTIETLTEEITCCEAAIMDIDHWLEINDFPARVGGRMSKRIKELRLKRRDLKDNLMILTPIHEFCWLIAGPLSIWTKCAARSGRKLLM